jgi:hypothetical protein
MEKKKNSVQKHVEKRKKKDAAVAAVKIHTKPSGGGIATGPLMLLFTLA